MHQQDDRAVADHEREIDRGTAGGDGREDTPIQDPDQDDLLIAPGLELAGGDRATLDAQRAERDRRWRDRPRSRRVVNLDGSRSVLAAIDDASRLAR